MLVAWFFAPVLSGVSGFAFRDAAHFYRPLFEYLRGEWLAGRPPMWNSYENIGVPLAAQNTSSVFYPGQLLLALPLDYATLYHAYIVVHVVLAAATSYALARHFGASRLAAGLTAISYAFSGSVLFQYCNVVFLVGAAWLPLALLAADRMLCERRAGWAAGFGAVLALMVLGGDPQLAYHAVLLAGLLALLRWRSDRRAASPPDEPTRRGVLARRPVLFAWALLVAGGLAAVQVLPTWEATPHSRRAKYESPRNVYELAAWLVSPPSDDAQQAWYDGLLGRGDAGHQRQVYQFSVAPARLVELVWPNVTGQAFPINRRWLAALRAEGSAWDLWTPSLYLGLLPLVLAAGAFSLRRRAAIEVRFGSWIALIGVFASLGVYGIPSAIRSFSSQTELGGVGPQLGGLYWWLTVVLPGYVYFRFPAKWFVVATLGLSLLAARGWDDAWQSDGRRARRWFLVLIVFSLLAAVTAVLGWSWVEARAAAAPALAILGPSDLAGARRDVIVAVLQTVLLSGAFVALFGVAARRPSWSRRVPAIALLLTVADLAIAGRYLVLTAPADCWDTKLPVMKILPEPRDGYRVFRQSGPLPQAWERRSSPDRLAELVRWDRETLWPKYPLPDRIAMLEASETIASDDYLMLLDVARRHGPRAGGRRVPHASILDLLAAQATIVAADSQLPLSSRRPIAAGMVFGTRPHALERAWIVHQVDVLPELTGRSRRRLRSRTEAVLFPAGAPRDWRQVAVVETNEPLSMQPAPVAAAADEACAVVYADQRRIEIQATLAAAGLVVLSDLFHPGWELTVESQGTTRSLPIVRTNRVMRGALLPAGTHRLVYRYRPASVFWGAAISITAALALAVAAACLGLRRLRRAH